MLAEIYQYTSMDKNRALTWNCDTTIMNVIVKTCVPAFKVNVYKMCIFYEAAPFLIIYRRASQQEA